MKRGPAPSYSRDAVLDAATEVFWARGYTDAKLDEILELTGVGRQSLYSGFGDKRTLFIQALERYVENFIEPRVLYLEDDDSHDGLGGVRQLIEEWKQGVALVDRRGCLVANSSAELGRRGDREIESHLASARQRVEDALVKCLDRAKTLGTLSPNADPTAIARVALMTADGLSCAMKTTTNQAAYGVSTLDQLMTFIEGA
ncbi:MAG: TetR/AcrR family transcriptional regulator [Erythrobacter sp.]|uniref:TetR/AcrR family transcriptional regulator n=1 Tax=Erythrobacter sp. TaxID=1042 RepID=UPI00261540F9|nr:TetR/AcrR family transcriptional regulator [Erythrobacter sp.]MDJ0978561.1 TetR/AcrR family transcriptional regulator [Erythrobacter sp.]